MIKIDTVRFGELEVDETKLLNFGEGLPAFEDYKQYALLHIEQSHPIVWMQSMTDGGIAFPVIDTFSIVADYAFDLGDEDVKKLELTSPDDVHVMSILSIPESIEKMTVNLAAPIVVNKRTGEAKQVILNGTDYGVRVPAFAAVCNLLREEDADAGTDTEDQ